MNIKTSLTLFLSFAAAACTVGPDYQPTLTSYNDTWSAESYVEEPKIFTPKPINTRWWTAFQDPLLEKYITQAVKNNKDINIALANVRKARALRKAETGSLFPSLAADAGATRSKSSDAVSFSNGGETRNLYNAGFDASWELDIFGGNRRAIEAADARAQSAIYDYRGIILSTLSEVVRTYYEARGTQKRIAITEKNTELFKQSLSLIEARVNVGESDNFDLSRAKGEYELTRARLPNLQADLKASVYTLSVLLGLPPEALLQEMQSVSPLPAPPDIVPVGLRSDILRRRPDVNMAERELAASVADIGVQTSELFPKFFLTGDLGSQARVFGDVFSADGGVWSLASMVQWSLFEGGTIRARIEAEKAESQAALADYEKTVLEALADAETALVRYGKELETRKRLAEGVQSRKQASDIAFDLFNAGEEDYLSVIDAQRELVSAEDSLVVSETNSILNLISLYTALGGGWESL